MPTESPRGEKRIGAIILAAGASQRMGRPKQLLPIDGKPMLVRAVEATLASSVWPVIVVVGAHAELVRPLLAPYPVLVCENEAWPEGMASSLRAGIATLRQFSRTIDGVITVLCDQPEYSAEVLARLIRTQRETGDSIVAARYAGKNGAPALFLREHFEALGALTGEEGARALLNGAFARVTAVDLPGLAMDLDTPADVQALEGRNDDRK